MVTDELERPVKLDPNTLYSESVLRAMYRVLDGDTLAAARKSGELRHCKIGPAVMYRGTWIHDWMERRASGGRAVG